MKILKNLLSFLTFKPDVKLLTFIGVNMHLYDSYYGGSSKNDIINKIHAISMASTLSLLLYNVRENSIILLEKLNEEHNPSDISYFDYFFFGVNLAMTCNQALVIKDFVLNPSVKFVIYNALIQAEVLPNIPEAAVQPSIEAYAVENMGNDVRPHID